MTPVEVLADKHPHGTRVRYMTGCKCMLCRAANSRYETERAAARKNGDWNGTVDAAPLRLHLRKLSRRGIGYKTVAAAADISKTTLFDVISRRKQRVRARTLRRCLEVTADAIADHALVKSAPTWAKVNRLLREGFSKAEIARRIGKKTPALQLNRRSVIAINASRVERLYRTVMAE
jgi:hypothetical protein